jgi:integrase/recombinase XerD
MSAADLPSLVQRFFTDRLLTQVGASPHTIASYRDTFRLLLAFASESLTRQPSDMSVSDLGAPLIVAFLEHVEEKRGCGVKTRNTRLAAVRSFFWFVAYADPTRSLQCQQLRLMPSCA